MKIKTDQDPSICGAIKTVFPNTRHRYCSWHVDKHVMEHLHLLHCNNSEFQTDYEDWFNSKDIRESERLWEALKEKYELQNNMWLMEMYEKRQHWVPPCVFEIKTYSQLK